MFTQVLERVNLVNNENAFLRSMLMQQPQYEVVSNVAQPTPSTNNTQYVLPMPQSRPSLPQPQTQPLSHISVPNFGSMTQPMNQNNLNEANLNSLSNQLNQQINQSAVVYPNML